jgi:hypothetical protein
MIIFPEGDKASRQRMRALIRQKHSLPPPSEPPLTWELFSLTPAGITPFHE